MSEYSQIRAGINNWSLESDDRLFRKIESFAQNFLNKVDALKADVQMTDYAITSNQVEVGNVFSRFNNLSNQKFTENKMQPFNDSDIFRRSNIDSTVIPTQSEPHQNIVERYQQALNIGMDNVNIAQFLNMPDDIDDRLSVSDAGERSYSIYSESSVMPGKNNRLPFIIGTKAFYDDDFVGIYENPDQKLDPASLSYQEISFPDASITIEQNYIPKIDPPPKPEPVQIPTKTDPVANSEQNSSIIAPPPPPAVNLGSSNIVVNAGAPPPPPNLLLPGIKPGSMPPPPTNNMIPPPMNNIMVPPPMNNTMPPPLGPPQLNTNIKGVPPPPPLNLLLQNQQNNKINNHATQPQIIPQNPPMNNNMGEDQKNSTEQKSIPIHLALQQMLAMKNKMQNPTPPQNEEINNSARGSIQQNMGFNPMQNNPGFNQNQNMGFNPMQSNPGFNQNQNMAFIPNQNNPGFNQNPNQNMGFNPMQNQQYNNNMPSNMGYMQPNMYNNNPQINNSGYNNSNQNPSISQQNLMDPSMEINMQFPMGFNPMQNYFQPAIYQQNQPQIPIISPPANNKMGLPPQSTYLNDQKTAPPANIPPPNKNITVNQKAPPPPPLKLLLQKAEDEKSKSPSPEKKQHIESKPNPSQFMNPMQNPPLNQQDGNQFSQPPPQNQPQGGMPNFAEALLAQQRKMMNKNKDPNANQQTSTQPPAQNQTNSQFRESLNALQGKKQDIQPVKEPEPIVEPPPPTVGFNPMALFKSQLEQKMMERGGGSIQPREDNKDESQGQDNLLPPRNRPTLNKGNTVSFGEPIHKADENLETLYKPNKLKAAKKSIFENEEGSDNDDPIFNKPKNRDKFENLFKPPVVNLEEKIPVPNTKKQDTPERTEYIEPKSNSNEKFNNKKLEDTTFLVSRDPVLANKDDLLEKPKIKIDNPAKISKLFDDSDDEKKKLM